MSNKHFQIALSMPTETTPARIKEPYPGLKPMTDKEADLFFGRDPQLKAVAKKLAEQHFVIVVGTSGSGKSSLVWAGLLPKLNYWIGKMAAHWVWERMTPTTAEIADPIIILATILAKRIGWDFSKVYETLCENGLELLCEIVSELPSDQLLVFIDQFEELFTIVSLEKRKLFIKILDRLMASEKVRVIATMRAEFLGQSMEAEDFGERLTEWFNLGQLLLARPNEDALRAMVEEPARLAGLVFEAGLVNTIIKDTGTESDNLPLMAFALEQLYLLKQGNLLTWQDYHDLGGVKGAIADTAKQVFSKIISSEAKLDKIVQNPYVADALLGEVFRELVEIDEYSGVAIRRQALLLHWKKNPDAQKLIKSFIDAQLLLTRNDDDSNHKVTLEIAHEALFREWSLLRDWIDVRKDQFLMRKRLQRDAKLWLEHMEEEAYRWVDALALEAGKMIKDLPYTPDEWEARFLGPVQREDMLRLINEVATHPVIRASIGVRLALLGDNRKGIGIENDLPDIVWCSVPPGEVILEKIDRSFTVDAFQISKFPITQIQFQLFIDAEDGFQNPVWWQDLPERIARPGKQNPGYGNYPVTNVTWLEAIAYCRWLSNRFGKDIRLPTEWQWQQAACSGQTKFDYPWGMNYITGYANVDETWEDMGENNLQKTTAVGLYPQGDSLQGVADLCGNVWEWCLNEYDNPANIQTSESLRRVVRGGSWYYDQDYARSSYRIFNGSVFRDDDIGFRICCVPPS